MQLNPARGRKLVIGKQHIVGTYKVYAAQPREGTETYDSWKRDASGVLLGLCSSTPRGDGNPHTIKTYMRDILVYAAQPREGTETANVVNACLMISRFMQLNPARGRKPLAAQVCCCLRI